MPPGTNAPAAIVLLTDGENNQRPDPLEAAQAAAERGIRIFTVGLGTEEGATLEVEGFRVHSRLDEPSLRRIAELTGGAYYAAADPAELASIYDDIETRFVIRPEATEVTSLFAGAGVLILLVGAAGALLWLGRLPVMDVLAPGAFLLLAIVPILVVVRIWLLRRRKPALRYSSLALIREAVTGSSWIRRHLPFALFTLGLASLVVAMARPVQIVSVPAGRTTVILAMDVSRSMCATDIPPNRLVAAEEAAASFIDRQGSSTQIGIVAFAGFAEIVQTPTTDQEVLLDVVESLTTGRRTAIGSAILESLDAIAEIDDSVAPFAGRRLAIRRPGPARCRVGPTLPRSSSC